MKKLIVVVLVLALASVANATLSFDVPGAVNGEITIYVSDTISIGIYSDGTGAGGLGQYSAILVNSNPAGGEWTGDYTIAGPDITRGDATVEVGAYGDPTLVEIINVKGDLTQLVPGTGFTVDFHCLMADETVEILLIDLAEGDVPVDVLTVHQLIPEPMTIALLGLGGLFLRRRK